MNTDKEKPESYYKPGMVNGDIIVKLEERIKQLEEQDRIWDKSSLVELVKTNEFLEEENRKLKEALELIKDSIEFVEKEHNANYVITTEDKKVIYAALNQKP